MTRLKLKILFTKLKVTVKVSEIILSTRKTGILFFELISNTIRSVENETYRSNAFEKIRSAKKLL